MMNLRYFPSWVSGQPSLRLKAAAFVVLCSAWMLGLAASPCQAGSWVLDHYNYNLYRYGRSIDIDATGPRNFWKNEAAFTAYRTSGEVPTPNGDEPVDFSSWASIRIRRTSSQPFVAVLQVDAVPVFKWVGGGEPEQEFWTRQQGHVSVHSSHHTGGSFDPHHPYSEQDPYKLHADNYFTIEWADNGFKGFGSNRPDASASDALNQSAISGNIYAGTNRDWSSVHKYLGGLGNDDWEVQRHAVSAGARAKRETTIGSRRLYLRVKLRRLSSTQEFNELSLSLRGILKTEVCQFTFGVGTDMIEGSDTTKMPRDRKLGAYVYRNQTFSWPEAQEGSTVFWDGTASYVPDISDKLRAALGGNPTYSWNTRGMPLKQPRELSPSPSDDTISQGIIGTGTQRKDLHHDAGSLSEHRTQWPKKSMTRVRITGRNAQTNKSTVLDAKAQIEWFPKPTTHFRTETSFEVIDFDTGEVLPLSTVLANDPQNEQEVRIDAYIEEINQTKTHTFETGQALVKASLEFQMMAGSWFVPDAGDIAVGGIGKVFKAVKTARVLERVVSTVNNIGTKTLGAVKRLRRTDNVALRITTTVTKEQRIGKGARNSPINGEEPVGTTSRQTCHFGDFCFVAGTPVVLADGTTKAIEQVRAGDLVLSKDESSGEMKAQKVTHLTKRQAPETLVLTFAGGERIETTQEHPFFVQHKGFTPAGLLAIGNAIVTRAGPALQVLEVEHRHQEATVYNFTVEGFHSYFVGNSALWVHNVDCGDPAPQADDAAQKFLEFQAKNSSRKVNKEATIGVMWIKGISGWFVGKSVSGHLDRLFTPNPLVKKLYDTIVPPPYPGIHTNCAETDILSQLFSNREFQDRLAARLGQADFLKFFSVDAQGNYQANALTQLHQLTPADWLLLENAVRLELQHSYSYAVQWSNQPQPGFNPKEACGSCRLVLPRLGITDLVKP